MTLSIQERLAVKSEPIQGAIWQWLCMLRCATPGTVTAVNLTAGTCTVQPNIQELVLKPPPVNAQNPSIGTTQNIPVSETIAPIQDVPMIMMRAGIWAITLPVEVGTECLLIFADSCIDGWWQNGGINAQWDRRRHDLSDAFALFGPWSQPNTIPNHSATNLEIRNLAGTIAISLGSTEISLKAPTVQVIPANTGTPLALVNATWHTWFLTHIYPFLTGLGYAGPAEPAGPVTTTLLAE